MAAEVNVTVPPTNALCAVGWVVNLGASSPAPTIFAFPAMLFRSNVCDENAPHGQVLFSAHLSQCVAHPCWREKLYLKQESIKRAAVDIGTKNASKKYVII